MARRAVLVGINDYDNVNCLKGCITDATSMAQLLGRNESGSKNFDCKLFTSDTHTITRRFLREKIAELFESEFDGDTLFYFSGHGSPTDVGGYLITQDAEEGDLGVAMNDLLTIANKSRAKSVFLILDCCFSGDLGNPANIQSSIENQAQLREGVTILTASKSKQTAGEIGGHGIFTQLVVGALSGGAADIRGRVSAASVYAYVEQALGAWDQRPMYKSHADCLPELRWCKPMLEDSLLRELPRMFDKPDCVVPMNPSFEHTHSDADEQNIKLFNNFKILRDAGLLKTEKSQDLYYTALASEGVYLTLLGQFYWKLAEAERL